jgi:hypothetical protein
MTQCPYCSEDPLSHSFEELGTVNNVHVFYSRPALARLYHDAKSIVLHYRIALSNVPPDHNWVWIFDGRDFGLTHMLSPQAGIELAKFVSTQKNLGKIIIVNPSVYVSSMYTIVSPFLYKSVRDTIVYVNEQPFGVNAWSAVCEQYL